MVVKKSKERSELENKIKKSHSIMEAGILTAIFSGFIFFSSLGFNYFRSFTFESVLRDKYFTESNEYYLRESKRDKYMDTVQKGALIFLILGGAGAGIARLARKHYKNELRRYPLKK